MKDLPEIAIEIDRVPFISSGGLGGDKKDVCISILLRSPWISHSWILSSNVLSYQ